MDFNMVIFKLKIYYYKKLTNLIFGHNINNKYHYFYLQSMNSFK